MSKANKNTHFEDSSDSGSLFEDFCHKEKQVYKTIGRWSYEEQIQYILFIGKHSTELENTQNRRSSRIFKLMSTEIPSRKPDQCRSHHQKMQLKYSSIKNIILKCSAGLPKLLTGDANTGKMATIEKFI